MGIDEQVAVDTESVDVSDDSLGRLTVVVPASWTAPSPAGRNRVVFVDVEAHVGEGFLPNVALRIDPVGGSDDLPSSNLVLSDRLLDGLDGPRRVRMLLSELADELLIQQVTTFESGGVAATVVASATQSQWPAVAGAFDEVSASAMVEGVAS